MAQVKENTTVENKALSIEETLTELNGLNMTLTSSNALMYDKAFKAHYKRNRLLCVVEECKEGSRDRTGAITNYQVKLAIVTNGTSKDVMGISNKTMQGYWVTSVNPMELDTIIAIEANRFCIVQSEGYHEESQSKYTTKRLVDKTELVSDKSELREGYEFVKSSDMNVGGNKIAILQDNKFLVLRRVEKAELDF